MCQAQAPTHGSHLHFPLPHFPSPPFFPPVPKAITFDGPEEAVALCAWRLHRSLEPWEVAEPPPRVEEEDERREKGRGKGKSKGPVHMTEMMTHIYGSATFGGRWDFFWLRCLTSEFFAWTDVNRVVEVNLVLF